MLKTYKGPERRKKIRRTRGEMLVTSGEKIFFYNREGNKITGGFDERNPKERRRPTMQQFRLITGEISLLRKKMGAQKGNIGKAQIIRLLRHIGDAEHRGHSLLWQYSGKTKTGTSRARAIIMAELAGLAKIRDELEKTLGPENRE